MVFNSYLILVYFLAFIAVYNGVKLISKNIYVRNGLLFLANLFILLTFVKEHTIIVLAVFSLLIYFLGRLISSKSSKGLLAFGLTFVVLLFSFRNYPYLQNVISSGAMSFIHAPIMSVEKIGLSYILFRYVHWLVESFKDSIHRPNPITFINYILFFPSILAGPIDTYNNFAYWVESSRPRYNRVLFFAGITRLFLGAFKTVAIVPLIIVYATDYTLLLDDFSPAVAIFINAMIYSAYIYIDFSGYSDIAIGSSYLIGIRTPENFDSPYISMNLSSFWKRWHMTFSNFLSLYVFKPVLRLYNSFINPKYRMLVTILGYLTTFTICGLWHGDTMNFVLWGLWHGIGLSINKVWTAKLKHKVIKSDTLVYRASSVLLTFVFVSIGWLFFHYPIDQLTQMYSIL
jgi:alginate O-acetyltransferase complex protein AlgI